MEGTYIIGFNTQNYCLTGFNPLDYNIDKHDRFILEMVKYGISKNIDLGNDVIKVYLQETEKLNCKRDFVFEELKMDVFRLI